MRYIRRIICLSLIALFMFLSASTALGEAVRTSDELPGVVSFMDIPGITDEEIELILELQRTRSHFDYGMILSTETFFDRNNNIRGFSALFC